MNLWLKLEIYMGSISLNGLFILKNFRYDVIHDKTVYALTYSPHNIQTTLKAMNLTKEEIDQYCRKDLIQDIMQ